MAFKRIIEIIVQKAFGQEDVVAVREFFPVVVEPVVVVAEDGALLKRPLAVAVVVGQGARRPGRRHVRSPSEAFLDGCVDVGEMGPVLFDIMSER